MRKFYLENEIGQRIDLQDQTFFHLPQGLGVRFNSDYGRTSDGFWLQTREELAQGSIVGELVFHQGYAGYKTLVDWLFAGLKIMLVYRPIDTDYLRDIAIDSVDKGDLTSGLLICPVSLRCLSPWYKRTPVAISLTPEPDGFTSHYPRTYPYVYVVSADVNAVDITPGGHLESALTMSVPGPLENPVITLRRKSTGDIIGRADLEGVAIASDQTLLYSTRPGNMGIWRVSAGGTKTDLIEYVDLTDNNFFRLPAGVACTLSLGSSQPITQSAMILLYEYYKAV